MTQFLASVRDAAEAELVIECGADIIDFKDPDHGALGALTSEVITAGVRAVAGRRATSATAGDWPLEPDQLVTAALRVGNTGVDFVKLGLLPGPNLDVCIDALRAVTERHKLVIVFFADHSVPLESMPMLQRIGCSGVLIDTFGKSDGRLRTHLSDEYLRTFVIQARSLGMFAGLAGSLRVHDIEPLMKMQPDILGFRGALCDDHARTGKLSQGRAREVCEEITRIASSRLPASPAAVHAP